MHQLAQKLIPYLISSKIDYRWENSKIELALPGGFGHLEIRDFNGSEVIIGLAGEKWQTTCDCQEFDRTGLERKITSYIQDIYKGKLLLIEEQQPGKATVKRIEKNLESYLQQLPNRTEFKIFNKDNECIDKSSIFSEPKDSDS